MFVELTVVLFVILCVGRILTPLSGFLVLVPTFGLVTIILVAVLVPAPLEATETAIIGIY